MLATAHLLYPKNPKKKEVDEPLNVVRVQTMRKDSSQ